MKMRDRLDAGEQSGAVYLIPCQNCPRHYKGQTGRRLSSRIFEEKRAVRRGVPLSQVATHRLEEDHEFDFVSTRILERAGNRVRQELLEAWRSDTNFIDRHTEVPQCYHALRSRSQVARLISPPRSNASATPWKTGESGNVDQTQSRTYPSKSTPPTPIKVHRLLHSNSL
ncbi:unnamed protein product [Schistocephalus solidus]|uniref:Uncharacterized protein n=1 Tax=Schistocephalus solidus TaxID=70667 RepID=A0A183T9U0_SCHSO|nr:unnamed protein product [Schistocephalus solidus]